MTLSNQQNSWNLSTSKNLLCIWYPQFVWSLYLLLNTAPLIFSSSPVRHLTYVYYLHVLLKVFICLG